MTTETRGSEALDAALGVLLGGQREHLDLGRRMSEADGGNLFHMDLLATAVLNRSMRLVRGFADLIRTNFLCAAPLVRLQLDNFLRFNASRHAPDLDAFVTALLRGTPVRKMKDTSGQPMTDANLLQKAAAEYPDLDDIYERGCAYIHLCEVHILHAAEMTGPLRLALSISEREPEVNDGHRISAVHAMTRVTGLVLKHVEGWVLTKAEPGLVRDPMSHAEWLLERGHVSKAKEWLRQAAAFHRDAGVVAAAKAKLGSLI